MLLGRKTTTKTKTNIDTSYNPSPLSVFHCRDSTSSTPLLSPFQPPVSLPPLKVLSLKISAAWDWLAFQHSTPPWRLFIRHQSSDTPRSWSMATLTQLSSFLFTLTYPVFSVFNPGLAPLHLPQQIASPDLALSLDAHFFISWSHSLILSLLPITAESWPSCFVLEQPEFIPVHPCTYTLGLPCNIPSTYWACPSMCSIDPFIWFNSDHPPCTHPFAHTQTLINLSYFLLWRPTSYFTRPPWESGAASGTVLQTVLFPRCVQPTIQWYEAPIIGLCSFTSISVNRKEHVKPPSETLYVHVKGFNVPYTH